MINRIAPPLIEPVAHKDMKAVQKALVKAFSLCAEKCEGIFYNVFILDKNGVLTAVYPPAEVKRFQFSNYTAVQKAFAQKKAQPNYPVPAGWDHDLYNLLAPHPPRSGGGHPGPRF